MTYHNRVTTPGFPSLGSTSPYKIRRQNFRFLLEFGVRRVSCKSANSPDQKKLEAAAGRAPTSTARKSPTEPRRRPRESRRGNPAPATPEGPSVAPTQEYGHVRERHGMPRDAEATAPQPPASARRGYPELPRLAAKDCVAETRHILGYPELPRLAAPGGPTGHGQGNVHRQGRRASP